MLTLNANLVYAILKVTFSFFGISSLDIVQKMAKLLASQKRVDVTVEALFKDLDVQPIKFSSMKVGLHDDLELFLAEILTSESINEHETSIFFAKCG